MSQPPARPLRRSVPHGTSASPLQGPPAVNHLLAWRLPARMGRDKSCTGRLRRPWLTRCYLDAEPERLLCPCNRHPSSSLYPQRGASEDFTLPACTRGSPGVLQLVARALAGREIEMRARPADPGCVWTARAPISLHLLRAANPRASSLSFICQWAHEVSNERRAQVVVPAGIEPARRHYFQAHRRGACTPSLTERNGTIHGPAACFPFHGVVAKAKCHTGQSPR